MFSPLASVTQPKKSTCQILGHCIYHSICVRILFWLLVGSAIYLALAEGIAQFTQVSFLNGLARAALIVIWVFSIGSAIQCFRQARREVGHESCQFVMMGLVCLAYTGTLALTLYFRNVIPRNDDMSLNTLLTAELVGDIMGTSILMWVALFLVVYACSGFIMYMTRQYEDSELFFSRI